jgi:hypothetical protein
MSRLYFALGISYTSLSFKRGIVLREIVPMRKDEKSLTFLFSNLKKRRLKEDYQ